MSNSIVSPSSSINPSNPILLLNQFNTGIYLICLFYIEVIPENIKEEAIPEINVSAISPNTEEPEFDSKNGADQFCDSLEEQKNKGNAQQSIEEPIIERYSEEASEALVDIDKIKNTNNTKKPENTKVEPIQIPAELMDTSQESLCKTEEKELEAERLNFVKNIEEDLRKRIGPNFIPESVDTSKNLEKELVKNTARFQQAITLSPNNIENILNCNPKICEKENSNHSNQQSLLKSNKKPIKLTVKIGKLLPKISVTEPKKPNKNPEEISQIIPVLTKRIENNLDALTFRGNAETERRQTLNPKKEKNQTAYEKLMQGIDEKKEQIKKLRKQETEKSLGLKTMIESLKIVKNDQIRQKKLECKIQVLKISQQQIRHSIVQLENNVKYMIKLAKEEAQKLSKKPISETARLPLKSGRSKTTVVLNEKQLERKYSEILRIRGKTNNCARSTRSYTIIDKSKQQSQIMSFVSMKTRDRDTPNFSKSKITKSKIFSPADSTPGMSTIAPEYYTKNSNKSHEFVKAFQDLPILFTHQTFNNSNKEFNKSICNPKEAIELLTESYIKTNGEKPENSNKLIEYWKNNICSKAIFSKLQSKDSFNDNSKESSRSMQLGSTNDSGDIRKHTQLALWNEKELKEAVQKYYVQ